MTAATIGFIGIIVGALLTSWLNYGVERHRRLAQARVSAHLIAAELARAAARVGSGITAERWWTADLSSEQWKEHAASLAAEVKADLLDELVSAYAVIELLENKRSLDQKQELSEKDLSRLEESREKLAAVGRRVREAVPRPVVTRASKPINAAAVAIALAAFVVLAFAALQPRADLTDASIATALQDQLPGQSIVDCNQSAGKWHCEVSYTPVPRGSCRVREPSLAPSARLVAREVPPTVQETSCGARARAAPTAYEVAQGSNGPVATPTPPSTPTPEDIELQMLNEAIRLEVPKPSFLDQAADWLFEGD